MTEAVRRTLLTYHSAGTKPTVPAKRPPETERAEPTPAPARDEPPIKPTPLLPKFPAEPAVAKSVVRPPPISMPKFPWPDRVRPIEQAAAPTAAEKTSPVSTETHEPQPLLNVPLRLVGVIGRLYVVLESDRGLVLLDQHAAHERILFEQMLARLEQQGNTSSQRLLLPETGELSVRDAQFLREQLATLTR